jgi:hypothetical protein
MSKRTLWLLALIAVACLLFLVFSKTTSLKNSSLPSLSEGAAAKVPDLAALNVQEWHEFTGKEPPFKVMLPTLPQHASDKPHKPLDSAEKKYEMYASQKPNGPLFVITIISFDPGKQLDSAFLEQSLQKIVSATPENVLIKRESKRDKGIEHLYFEVKQDNFLLAGSMFAVNNRLFVLAETAERDLFNRSEFDFFINSFDLQ